MSRSRSSRSSSPTSTWRSWFGGRQRSERRAVRRPELESLEDRLAPAVFNVNSLADILNPPTGVVTLRSAIQQANTTPGGNTINLTLPGTYRITLQGANTDNTAGEFAILPVGGNLSILNTSGGGVTVDGGGLNRVFDLNPAVVAMPFTVTFQGFTITDGVAAPGDADTGSGGGIRAQGGASVVLNNVNLTGNTATADGGGISLESLMNNSTGTLTVNASQVTNNHAGDAGGGIETDGTGLVSVNTGSVVSGNTCVNQGAGIWLDAGGAGLNVSGSVVGGNVALTMLGGGIGNAGAGTVNLFATVVQDNVSGGMGGGFGDAAGTGNLNIANCVFLNNRSAGNGAGIQAAGPSTVIFDTFVQGNVTGANGGGLVVSGTNVMVQGTEFSGNFAASGAGVEDTAGTTTFTNDVFANNHAYGTSGGTGGTGGGLDVPSGTGNVTLANSLFRFNVASNGPTGAGGGISQAVGTLSITYSQFTANAASSGGGGVFFSGTTFTLNTSTFDGNYAPTGGAINLNASGTTAGGTGSRLTNDTLANNAATDAAGALAANGPGDVTLVNDTMNNNAGGVNGGGIALFGGTLSLQSTIVSQDVATNGPDVFTNTGFSVHDNGSNLIGTLSGSTGFGSGTLTGNPNLTGLQDNGVNGVGVYAGTPGVHQDVQTEMPLPNSPAVGHGATTGAPATDERGFPTPATPAIGAFQPQLPAGDTANQVYVENLFETLLHRASDNNGIAFFVNQLNGGATPNIVVQEIENSPEYINILVDSLYRQYLHRPADQAALQLFGGEIANGTTLETVAVQITRSDEYFGLHGADNFVFLDALFSDALGRVPDPASLSNFNQALNQGVPRQAVSQIVFTSPEYYVDQVEADFLLAVGRPADQASLSFFVGALQNGATEQNVLATLLGSTEAFSRRS